MDGEALVDQHVLTGEARPGEKAAGDEILASTVASGPSRDCRRSA
ncbi:MAG: hypothetical protein AAF281_02505 [Pseudomonadota bacterium]